jgi:hypothetical protein
VRTACQIRPTAPATRRASLAAAGLTAVIKPPPLRAAVAGGFTLDDFTLDETTGTVTCPNVITRHLTATRYAVFGASCHGCPLRQRCTTSKSGRTMRIHQHHWLTSRLSRWPGGSELGASRTRV